MYPEALPALVCPDHPQATLGLESETRGDDGEIEHGRLRCPICRTAYPIEEGIVDFIGSQPLPRNLTQWINTMPVTAWGYERIWRSRALSILTGEPFGFDRELPLVTGLTAPERGGLYVDIASSSGLYARALDRARGAAAGHVMAVDHAHVMLQQARRMAHDERLRISCVRARAQELPLRAQSVAGAVMGASLNEIGAADVALREIRRVLRDDGRFVMMNLVRTESRVGRLIQRFFAIGDVRFWSLVALNDLLRTSGLHLRAQWRYRVVVFSVLRAKEIER